MRLNPADFDKFLAHIGQQVTWRRAYGCACVNPASGQPDPKHALCAGKGRIWDAALPTIVGVASQKTQAQWAQSGLWESGDMVLSIPQSSLLYDSGHFDRILMLNSTDPFSQPLVRGGPGDRLIFPVAAITRVFWLSQADRNQVVEGGIPVVSAIGALSWTGGVGEPPPGTTYSITGTKYSEYFVFNDLGSDRGQHSGARLPKKLVARRFDLFSR